MTIDPAPKRRGRPPKNKTIELTNPDCSNPACTTTCSPQCENLHANIAWREEQKRDLTPLEEGVLRVGT